MKIYQIVKTVLYLIGGLAILIFHNELFNYVDYVVGTVILLYGIDIFILGLTNKTLFKEEGLLAQAITHTIIGVIMYIVPDDIVITCTIWAVWTILREGKELSECIKRFTEKKPAILNTIESLIVIVLSFIMIVQPTEDHAKFHLILLGIELILEIVFPIINHFLDKQLEKKRA